jgi:type IV secretory pathway VirD2 relaxase
MAGEDDFELWLGRIGKDKALGARLRVAANRAGRQMRAAGGKPSKFTGARIGRGAGVGRVLSSRDRGAGLRARRVIVKTRIVKLAGKGVDAARAHLRYLQRDGTTREGERGELYGREREGVDGKAFLERGSEDRHQFRFIVAAEDGAEYEDLKPLVRRLMADAERDLGTRLDWVAVDHFNTGHPHSHVIVRGVDERGKDLVIARDYLTHGLRERATALVNLDLGPRTDLEIARSQQAEITQERFTGIDRRLIRSADALGHVRAIHRDGVEQSLRAGRLQTLARLQLAREVSHGTWSLDPELEPALRRMGERGDIIRTMNRAMRERLPQRALSDYAIYEPGEGKAAPIIGRVVARGLSDELYDRRYLIVDGLDGISRYVDIGTSNEPIPEGGIVRIEPRSIGARDVDRTVAEVAAANGGRYSIDDHLSHDAQATEAFAQKHVRRLEAIRRTTGGVEREPDGTWIVRPDHLARAEDYERVVTRNNPMVTETLSTQPLDRLYGHDGATWLDRELSSAKPALLGRGFGAEVRTALVLRQQWLVEQELVQLEGDQVRLKPNAIARLQQRELTRVAGQLSRELGLHYVPATGGERVEGKLGRAVQIGDRKFALIERSHEFTLVPWRPVLERAIGKQVAGIMREGGIDWTIGRSRGLSIDM